MQKALVSVMGADRPGIIAGVSAALYQIDVNILDISQTILGGYFTMLMIVDLSRAKGSFAEIAQDLAQLGERLAVEVHMQRVDLFDAMHRV